MLADGDAGDAQLTAHAVVCLHQYADGVGPVVDVNHARTGPRAALEFVADHAGPSADIALRNRSAARAVESGEDVLRPNMEAVDVVELAVPRLGNDRQRPPISGRIGFPLSDAPLNCSVAHDADAVRVGDQHGPFEKSGFIDPVRPCHFAVAIEAEHAGEYGLIPARFAARENGGDPGANGVALDQRRIADCDAGHIGDRVERAGRTVERYAQIARAGKWSSEGCT